MRTVLVSILWIGLLAGSCQSSRVRGTLPTAREYAPVRQPAAARKQAASSSAPSDSLLPPDANGRLASRLTFDLKLHQAAPPAAQTPADITPPRRLAAGPDPATRRINILGGAIEAAGIGLMVNADPDQYATRNEEAAWNERVKRLAGLFLILMGGILLLYQGKNGRARLRRQARLAAGRQAE